jgi:hypothetical protein
MTISVRLESKLEKELSQYAKIMGKSKSELIRNLIDEYIKKKKKKLSPWETGKDLFGCEGSKKGDLSVNRKLILKEKLRAKKNCC